MGNRFSVRSGFLKVVADIVSAGKGRFGMKTRMNWTSFYDMLSANGNSYVLSGLWRFYGPSEARSGPVFSSH